jgi:hypothetical protein
VKANVYSDLLPRLIIVYEVDCVVAEARTASVFEKDCSLFVAEIKLARRLTRIIYCKRPLPTFKRFGL